MLKKNDWHENVWQPVVNRDKSHERSGRPDINRDTCHELKRGPTGRRSSTARHLGCVFQDMKPPKSFLRKSSDMQKPIQRVKITKAIAGHTKIRDQNPSLGYICPGEPHQRSPNAPKFEDRSQEETEWQEQGAREAAWKLAKSVLKLKEQEKATFFSPSENRCLLASTLEPEEREFVVDCGASMHMISKKGLEWCWNGYFDEIVQSYDSHNQQWWSVDAWEGKQCMSKNWIYSWLWKSSKTRQQYCRLESFAMKTDILMNGPMVKNHISLKTGFGLSVTRRTSFLSWFQACQIRLLDLTHQPQGHFKNRRVIAQHLLPPRLHHLQ